MWEGLWLFPTCVLVTGGGLQEAGFELVARHGQKQGNIDARKVFVKEITALATKRRVDSCIVPTGFVLAQTFPVPIVHFMVNWYINASLLEPCGHSILSQSPDKPHGGFYSRDMKTALALDSIVQRITVKRSTSLQLDAELGLFFCIATTKDEVTASCYGSTVYANLSREVQNSKTYG